LDSGFTVRRHLVVFLSVLLASFVTSAFGQASGLLTVHVGPPTPPPVHLVKHDDVWRYRKGTSAPQADWQSVPDATLDTTWLEGPGGLGYGDGDDATVLGDMQNKYSTLYARRSFEISTQLDPTQHLVLVVDFDDGFVAYLDGREIARANAPGEAGAPVPHSATATAGHEASAGNAPTNPPARFPLGRLSDRLQPGLHVLALHALNQTTNSSDLSLIADLWVEPPPDEIQRGTFFTLVRAGPVLLSGTNTVPDSVRVLVNAREARFDPIQGGWSKSEHLAAAFNQLTIQAVDAAGRVLAATKLDLVHDAGSAFVGGALAGDTTWEPALGLIRVTNTVVPAGGSLTIREGAVVLLSAGASIRATNASVAVLGAADAPVHFLPADGSTVWGGAIVSGTNATLHVAHADFTAGYVELLDGVDGVIQDSWLHDYTVDSPAIVHTLRAKRLLLRRVHVSRYYEHLIQLTPAIIEDCLLEHITGDGIDFDGAPPGSVIRRCTIRHGAATNVDAIDLGGFGAEVASSGVLVEGCVLYDFPFDKGVSIGERAKDVTVRDCVIYGVDAGVAVKDSSVATVHHNTIVSANFGLNRYEKVGGQGGGHATAFNNSLWNTTTSIGLDGLSSVAVSFSDASGDGVFPGEGNLNVDPLFLDAAARDYRLAPNSPCRGVGRDGADLGAGFPVGSSLADTDGDGMSDVWEVVFGFEPNDPSDAGLDSDGDGLTNGQEFTSGTDPRDAQNYLKVDAVRRVAEGVMLRFAAAADRSYSVQYRDSLTGGRWITLSEVTPAPVARAVEVTDADAARRPMRFYRLLTPRQR
jgi:hypothetical protein